jgi:hypothetical protein
MADTDIKEETALVDEEVAAEAVDDPSKQPEAADEAGDGGGGKPFIVYYNCLSRIVMAVFLIAAGSYTIPSVWLNSPTGDFKNCGK